MTRMRMAYRIVDAILLAYQALMLTVPLGIEDSLHWGIAASLGLGNGASLADVCRAAGWATPNNFASRVLLHMC